MSRLSDLADALDETDDPKFIDYAVGALREIDKIVTRCADDLIAVHNTTGIDVYDRVPGWYGVIRLVYPDWSDPESAYFDRCEYK